MVRMAAFRSLSKFIGVSFRSCSQSLVIDGNAKPECVLDDAQADLAAERHQRFRVKLHAADRQGLVLDRHGDAVLGARGHAKHLGYAVALDIERMIAADHDLLGQVLHQPPAPYLDPRRTAMRRLPQLPELAAKIFADRLHPETDAEDRQFLAKRGIDGL